MTLSEFLQARIAEDEAEAQARREHSEGCWPNMDNCQSHYGEEGQWSWGPARVLAECEAKRRIVSEIEGTRATGTYTTRLLTILLHLAMPYADHPDYHDEWKP